MSEEVIFDDTPDSNFRVEFGVDDQYKDSCTIYNKCSLIKQVLLKLPDNTKFITRIEIDYYIDYIFDIDDTIIETVWGEITKDVVTGISTLKRLKRCPKWCFKPL